MSKIVRKSIRISAITAGLLKNLRPDLAEHGAGYIVEVLVHDLSGLPPPLEPAIRLQLGASKRGQELKGKPALNPAGRKPAKQEITSDFSRDADRFIIEDERRPNCRTYRLLCGDRIVARDVLPAFVELLASAGLLAEEGRKSVERETGEKQ